MESSKRRQKFAKKKSSKRLLTKCHLAIIYLLPAANWFLQKYHDQDLHFGEERNYV